MMMMMLSGRLPSFIPQASISSTRVNLPKPSVLSTPSTSSGKSNNHNSWICKATAANNATSAYSITEYDLYDLLGVDSCCDKAHIKLAYRALQKRCHPDIAGPAGHDMAIILNEAYAVLSDPSSRSTYDKEQAKLAELQGYTGKPIYSVWFGSESEQRAVFVDEVKCVGCLKCALFAQKTFAVESVYGRARAVGQWADPEHTIQEAIESCPVDCISIVERSNLAALEFLMSKQPRGNVRIGAGNTVGASVSNIFVDVEKFQAKYRDAMNKASNIHAKEPDFQREARISAIKAIRAISNWLYWQSPNSGSHTSQAHQYLKPTTQKSAKLNIDKLRDVAAARKQARETSKPMHRLTSNYIHRDEYWTPSTLALAQETSNTFDYGTSTQPRPSKKLKKEKKEEFSMHMSNHRNPFMLGFPLGIATVATVIVRLQVREGMNGDIKEHIGGSLALNIVNSSWLQVLLAGLMWYFIGMITIELAEAFRSSMKSTRNKEDI